VSLHNLDGNCSLADYAERLLRQNSEELVAIVKMSSADAASFCEGTEALIAMMRVAVEVGDFRKVIRCFGNSSDAGFRFLVAAMPHIPQEQRAACVEDVWTSGQYGEHEFLGNSHVPGRDLTALTVELFEQAPELRKTAAALSLPDRVEVYRGVQAKNLRCARSRLHRVAWTLRRDVALWFAYRGRDRKTMFLGTATGHRDRILAYFDNRHEAEVIVNPKHLEDLKVGLLSDEDMEAARLLVEKRHEEAMRTLEAKRVKVTWPVPRIAEPNP
jgi:hypothetical protein